MCPTRSRSVLLAGTAIVMASAVTAQTARLQVIHNCADLAAASVDVYVNGDLLLDDFAFRTATPFIDVPAGVVLSVAVAPGNSTSVDDAIFTQPFTLTDGGSFILVASGTVSPTGYSPATPFSLEAFGGAQEAAAGAGTDVLVMHGSTDAPTVDVFESAVLNATAVDNITYPEFQGYLSLPTEDYTLEVRTGNGVTTVASYSAPLAALGLDGAAITVLASGFLDPTMNSNGPGFGLWVATATGGDLIPLPLTVAQEFARIQVIHNSADAAAAIVDVYIDSDLAIDNFAFRTATPFIDVPAGVEIVVGIAPGNSTSAANAIATFPFTLDADGSYIIVANGIVSATGYSPVQPFTLSVNATAQEAAMVATNTDVLVMHGATDAPVVDVAEISIPAGTLVNDLAYDSFAGYLELGTADYAVQVQTSTGTPVATYAAPLSTLGLDGAALTVLASGFLAPANNSNGPAFGLYVALATGGALIPLPLITNVGLNEVDDAITFTAWPNPATDLLNLSIAATEASLATVTVTDMTGRTVLNVPSSMINAGENRMTLDLGTLSQGLYMVSIASNNGIRTTPVHVVR